MIPLPASLHGSLDAPSGPEIDRVMRECGRTARLALEDVHGVLGRLEVGLDDVEGLLSEIKDDLGRAAVNSDLDGRSVLERALRGLGKEVRHPLQELRQVYRRLQPFLDQYTVGFVGSTKAGKSTLLEAFIAGGGARIGKGGHRTTRATDACQWGSIRLLDTPGMHAVGGQTDTQNAQEAIDECDLVLFVVTDDSQQEEQLQALSGLRLQAKAVHILLNVKKNLTDPLYLKRALASPESLFNPNDLQGHIRRIRSATARHPGLENVQVTAVCALAGHLSNQPKHQEIREDLVRLSRLTEIRDLVVRDLLTRGPVRRLQTIYDAFILRLNRAGTDLREQQHLLQQQGENVGHGRAAFSTGARTLVERQRRDIKRSVETEIRERSSMVASIIDDYTMHGRLTRDVDELFRMSELRDTLGCQLPTGQAQEATDYVSKYARALERATQCSLGRFRDPGLRGGYESHRRNLGRGAVILGAVAAVGAITGSTILAPALPFLIGAGLLASILGLVANDRKVRVDNQSKARTALKEQLKNYQVEAERALVGWHRDQVEGRLLGGTQERIATVQRFLSDAASLHGTYLRLTLEPGRSDTDRRRMERCLVALCPRLAGTDFRVIDVTRTSDLSARILTAGVHLEPDEVRLLEQTLGEAIQVRTQAATDQHDQAQEER